MNNIEELVMGSAGSSAEGGLLRDRAYRALKDLLIMGHTLPDPLLSSRRLSKLLGMSNTPVRSAIERLEAEGFISISPQRGIVVRELSDKEIADHYEIREAIEPFVLEKLAGALTAEQADRLEANLREQETCLEQKDLAQLIRLDTEFHLLFCDFLGNEEITRSLLQLRDKVHRLLMRFARHIPARLASSVPEHVEIARSVIGGDGSRAASAMRDHLERGRKAILPVP